jgi:hypothetical protein
VKRELTESVESFLRPLEKEVKSYRNRDYSDYIIGVATDSVISLIEDYDVYFDDEDNPSIVYIKQDYLFEIVDNNTDIYNGDLIKWLQDDDNAVYDVEDYLEKYGYNKEGFFRMLMGAQSNIIERAIYSVLEDIDGIEIR